MYEPQCVSRDSVIKQALKEKNVFVKSFNSLLLWEPWDITSNKGKPFSVFTPFYRKGCLHTKEPRSPSGLPDLSPCTIIDESRSAEKILTRPKSSWECKLEAENQFGELEAIKKLEKFIAKDLGHYKLKRNYPGENAVSGLSPHLHFGEISPNTIWYAIKSYPSDVNTDHFCSELGWREFAYYLLYHRPEIVSSNLKSKFDSFPWGYDEKLFHAWKTGQTGVPMVDAGMRELWQTGYMHNRLRMIVASFLVKNLFIHWKHGANWFLECLFDADLANNSAGWQWASGCGVDSAPYLRIFNPIKQADKFDPDGVYIRRFIPEISKLPFEYLTQPWKAPSHVLQAAGVELGSTYPLPIVDFYESSKIAQSAYESLE